jgi:hypothetical protein
LVKGKEARVALGVAVGPRGVGRGVLVGVAVGVWVGVLLGKVGVIDGSRVGRRVFVGWGVWDGSGTIGVQVGARTGVGVCVSVGAGKAARGTAVGRFASSTFNNEPKGVLLNVCGDTIKSVKIAPANSATITTTAAIRFTK